MAGERFKTQVMILHPEQGMLDACVRLLGDDDYTVHVAQSGREALSTLAETPIDVMVTAENLSGMSGTEALREARKRSPSTMGILLAAPGVDDLSAVADAEHLYQVLRSSTSASDIRSIVEQAAKKSRLQELQRSANDSAHPQATDAPPAADTSMRTRALKADAPPPAAVAPDPGESMRTRALREAEEQPAFTSTVTDLPTAGLRTHAGGREIEVLVLSNDAQFYEAITAAASGQHKVHHAPTIQEGIDILGLGRVGVLVTDAAVAPRDVEVITARLRQVRPSLVTIVAGRRDDGDELMGLISSGIVYRFLLKPVSAGRARLAIEASVRKSIEMEQAAPSAPPSTIGAAMRSTIVDIALDDDGGMSRMTLAGIGLAVVVLLGGGVWLALSGGDEPAPAVAAPTPAESTVTQPEPSQPAAATPDPAPTTLADETVPADPTLTAPVDVVTAAPAGADVEDLRRQAFRALAAGQVATPDDDNALTLYAEALRADPTAEGLQAELDNAVAEALSLTESAMIDGRLDDALTLLTRLREVSPYQPRLPFLEAQLRKEQRRALVDSARALAAAGDTEAALAELDRASALSAVSDPAVTAARDELLAAEETREIDQLLSVAAERVGEGNLITPASDNARYYYRTVLNRDPENTAATQGLAFVGERLIASAEAELADGNLSRAEGFADEARETDAAADRVAAVIAGVRAEQQRLADIAAAEQAEAERLAAEEAARGAPPIEASVADASPG
ncbi:MAG: response regulator, partial [Pseudomonadota bacterium]